MTKLLKEVYWWWYTWSNVWYWQLSRWWAWSWDISCALWLGENTGVSILHEQEKIFLYYKRNREIKASIFAPPALSTGIWKEPAQSSIRDLLQCWMRRETAIQQMIGWICFHLSFALLRDFIVSIRSLIFYVIHQGKWMGCTVQQHNNNKRKKSKELDLLQSCLEMQLSVSLLISSQNIQAWMVQLL